jgi:hypothetical protein
MGVFVVAVLGPCLGILLGLSGFSTGVKVGILALSALLYFVVVMSSRTKSALAGEIKYPVVDDAALDAEMLATAAEFEGLGYSRAPVVHQPTGSNYQAKAVMLLLFNDDRTRVVSVSRLCGPMSVVLMSFFEGPEGESAAPYLLSTNEKMFQKAGPDEMMQALLGADAAKIEAEHGNALTWLKGSGLEPVSMSLEATLCAFKVSIARGRRRVEKAPVRFTLRTMARAMMGKSYNLGPIKEQVHPREVVSRLVG